MTEENMTANEKTAKAIETAIKVLKETLQGGNTVPCWDVAESMIELEKTLNDYRLPNAAPAGAASTNRSWKEEQNR